MIQRTRLLLGLLLCSCLPNSAIGQTWARRFPSAGATLALRTVEMPNGQLALLELDLGGGGRVTFLGSDGVPQSALDLDSPAIALWPQSNGNLAFAGSTTYPLAWYGAMDMGGTMQWSHAHTSASAALVESGFSAVREAQNGDLLVTGWTAEDDCDRELLLTRVDAGGNFLWDFRLGSASAYFVGNETVELAGGELVAVGATSFGRPLAVGLSSSGTLLWTRSFVRSGSIDPWARVEATSDGNFVFLQGQFAQATGARVFKMDPQGQVLWQASYGGTGMDVAADVLATPGGGCIVVGSTTSFGAMLRDLRLFALDGAGELLWQHRFGGPGDEYATALERMANGDLLVTGTEVVGGGTDTILLRLDALGQLQGCAEGSTWAHRIPEVPAGLTPSGPVRMPDLELVPGPGASPGSLPVSLVFCPSADLGQPYCTPAVPNSSGQPARLTAWGSGSLGDNQFTLVASDLPQNQFGYFLAGQGMSVGQAMNSQGNICLLGSPVFRLLTSTQNSGSVGAMGFGVDLMAIPGHGPVLLGETWAFQGWFRDANPGATSNFTAGLRMTFP